MMTRAGPPCSRGDRFAVELRRDQDIVVETVGEADVGGIAVVAGEKDMLHFRFWPNEIDEGEEGDAAANGNRTCSRW